MAIDKTANKYEDLLKLVHKGIDPDQPIHKTGQEEKATEPVDTIPVDVVADGSDPAKMEPDAKPDNPPASTTSISTELPSSKIPGKKKRKISRDTHSSPHRRLGYSLDLDLKLQ